MKKPTVSFQFAPRILAFVVALGLAFGAIETSRANENGRSSKDCKPAIWRQVKKLAQECVELRESGEKCDSIVTLDPRSVSFELDGHEYRAEIVDSQFADGGDLNDVLIDRDDGCQYELRNIPAFGDLLQALASVKVRSE